MYSKNFLQLEQTIKLRGIWKHTGAYLENNDLTQVRKR